MSAPFAAQSYQRVVLLQTAAQWAATADKVLQDYETGRESDTGYEKTGDGTTTWADLEYDTSSTPTLRVVDPDMQPFSNNPAPPADNPFSLSGWTGSPTVTTSYGIYADTSIDKGTTKYFIYSLSASPSLITGPVGIGGAPNANAMLDVQSTTKAFMPPRMTTTEKGNIASPTAGMVVYDSTLNKLCVYTGAAWQTVTSI